MAEIIGVRFKSMSKVYFFDPAGHTLERGSMVVVETARGMECGEVVTENREVEETEIVKPLKKVIRPATAEDIRRVVDSHRDWVEKTVRRQQEQLAASPPEPTAQEMQELARQGREYLPRRVAYWAARMDVMPTGLHITAARTRWGSCSGKNSLCFSLFLMRYPPEAIDAVVVHELAHIRHKNHGPEFYRLVETTLPDYRQRIALLKQPSSGRK